MITGNHLGLLIPLLVAVLTAAGGVIGVRFRDADAHDRRRGVWLWMLVAVSAIATYSAIDSTSGGGSAVEAAGLGTAAVLASVGAHVLWRRIVLEAEQSTKTRAAAATGLAVIVIIASVAYTYVDAKACREVRPLVGLSAQSFVVPGFSTEPGQGPTVADFEDRAEAISEQARQVSPGEIADHAAALAILADEIADAVRTDDAARHALLGAQYYDSLKPIIEKCRIQLSR